MLVTGTVLFWDNLLHFSQQPKLVSMMAEKVLLRVGNTGFFFLSLALPTSVKNFLPHCPINPATGKYQALR
jgi:hypothetical protein